MRYFLTQWARTVRLREARLRNRTPHISPLIKSMKHDLVLTFS